MLNCSCQNDLVFMLDYLKSILPRIQQYSKKLDDEANFVEIPWGFIDGDGEKVIYIFRKNQKLLVSKKGEVVEGKWEYLPVIQSLLIEHDGKKKLFNQGFIDPAIMVLRKDNTEDLLPLANQKRLPNFDIEEYLTAKFKQVPEGESLSPLKDETPRSGKIRSELKLLSGEKVFIDHDHHLTAIDSYLGGVLFDSNNKQGSPGEYRLLSGWIIHVDEKGKVVDVNDPGDNTVDRIIMILFVIGLIAFLIILMFSGS